MGYLQQPQTRQPRTLSLFFFIDALGWQILQQSLPTFLDKIAPHRRKLTSLLGYSSACDPSIISGLSPNEHLHWSSFFYSPETSPFGWLRWLQALPSFLADHHRSRYYLSRAVAKYQGYTGYLQLYNVPFQYLPYFDYAEKKWLFGAQGLLKGETLFDHALNAGRSYYVNKLHSTDEQNFLEVGATVTAGIIDFAYVMLGKLDALMHSEGTQSKKIPALLQWYDDQISLLYALASRHYQKVNLCVFSDHGMRDVQQTIDLQAIVSVLGLVYGKDYIAMYDSTMGRFWYLNENARKRIVDCLQGIPEGDIVTSEELKRLGVYFPDGRYGETIFLLKPGLLIIPSFMGRKRIAGMHGYHPDDPSSDALLLSNREIPGHITHIPQVYEVLTASAGIQARSTFTGH